MLTIHPQFRLDNKAFSKPGSLLDDVKTNYPDDYDFLKALLYARSIDVQTSGSTGQPKTITHTVQALQKSAEATGKYFELKPGTKALHCLSSAFIAGKMMWVRALHLGWHLTRVLPEANPLQNISEHFDFAAMVPLQAQSSYEQLDQIKTLIIGGAPLSKVWEEKLAKLNTDIYLTYGMTETITHIAVRNLKKSNAVFETLPSVKISQDKRGCLTIDVPYISTQKFVTNDVVDLISNTSFKWLGRYDHVINTGGIKLYPELIEQQLQPYISCPFIISSIADETLGDKMVLVINSKAFDIDLNQLSKQAGLSAYHQPKQVIFMTDFPLTINGKIKRNDVKSNINKYSL
ncbi:MAG: O-succinylbenzoic acid--CoA ligase [Flavobacteriales bacterium]|nr:MAG: O-succinylbenzoic acid--CoA ligase [Flavobacteriales bacterium]